MKAVAQLAWHLTSTGSKTHVAERVADQGCWRILCSGALVDLVPGLPPRPFRACARCASARERFHRGVPVRDLFEVPDGMELSG